MSFLGISEVELENINVVFEITVIFFQKQASYFFAFRAKIKILKFKCFSWLFWAALFERLLSYFKSLPLILSYSKVWCKAKNL